MNVLLSRAKWKLIIVGSYEFLAQRFPEGAQVDEELAFLKKMLDTISELEKQSSKSGIPSATVAKYATLTV